MKTLYLAKEPGLGVRDDLSKISGEVTIVDCLNGYIDWYKKKGYNCISTSEFFSLTDMKFSMVLGNPPYSDRSQTNGAVIGGSGKSLDDKFTLQCIAIADRVKLIIRPKEFSRLKSKFKQKLFDGNHLRSITYLDDNTFPSIQNTVTCIIDWDHNYVGETVITYDDGTVVSKLLNKDSVIKLNNPDYVASVDDNMRHRYLRGKVSRHEINDDNNGTRIVEIMGKGNSPVIRNTSSHHTVGLNEHGVIMNYNSSWDGFDKMYVKELDTCISQSVIMLRTESDDESRRLIEHLKSDEIVKWSKKLKTSFSNSARIFEMVPDMPCDS